MITKRRAARLLVSMVGLAVVGGLIFGGLAIRSAERRAARDEVRLSALEQKVRGDEGTVAKLQGTLTQLQGTVNAVPDPRQPTVADVETTLAQLQRRVSADEALADHDSQRLSCLASAVNDHSGAVTVYC